MRVFKFGGASVKDASSVKNVVRVLEEVGHDNTLLVVSAMGKTTNAMEDVVNAYFKDKSLLPAAVHEVIQYHDNILHDLFPNDKHPVFAKVKTLFDEVQGFLVWNKSPKHGFVYDQVVGYGELVSTTILSAYLNEIGIANQWLDVRSLIKTNDDYRDAKVNWDKTQINVNEKVDKHKLNITQGFLGSDDNNFTTTLGREGSDYTAAILAYCLNAEEVTIWKDVPGVLNADPRYFEKTELLNKISYREAIELAFYGASVIHPKTLQPLQRKEIPLHVKSFINPKDKGTTVGKGIGIEPKVPCFIVKKNQVLMKLSSLDFSFIVEDSISELFKLLHDHQMKVDLIQNSAISFSVCVDNKFDKLEELLNLLKSRFKVVHHEGVSLYTIRHFDTEALTSLQNGKEILLEQRGKETVQLVVQ
ncbi:MULTISPECIES: aspartate kinase [Arenibacter]|uniref:aspartate kinase n=1 Tax=Arenibacter TaxID=178469 RepID=UPI0004DF36E3|nr:MULTISPECIES: aspartate kinase [Arenibacter]GBF21244.1 lysine-sensitive aspartokinase 3 [Arenibacter sp. NBRC 103722]|tara:strand:- start:2863 stop:4113 length:1251 start_codon:yes stop_codon:yes gene_type:complete